MSNSPVDVIVVGSGAGGAATAFKLVQAGLRVKMLEKGAYLPRDGSTLDTKVVLREGRFKNTESWLDKKGNRFVPGEFYNVGGKTKWYGAALLRFSPHEFLEDRDFNCLPWPIEYSELEPYYEQSEQLLHVNYFENEPGIQALVDKLVEADASWRPEQLPLGLKKEILNHPTEAKHFDGFASACGYKSDAQVNFLHPLASHSNFELLPNQSVVALLSSDDGRRIYGVRCEDGTQHMADTVVLAAGAMSTPRLVQWHVAAHQLEPVLPSSSVIGANFKLHINSALLAFSPFTHDDVLRKTTILFNDRFPHTTVQCLGWMDGEILGSQLPAAVPKFVTNAMGRRAYGFFVTTEDGSHLDNKIRVAGDHGLPVMDYDLDRIPASRDEHQAAIKAIEQALRHAGMIGVDRHMGLAGTAHALGSVVCGDDPLTSAVDGHGKVHDIDGLYIGDGSVLPRSSRVNPALTIYAWGLRLGDHLAFGI